MKKAVLVDFPVEENIDYSQSTTCVEKARRKGARGEVMTLEMKPIALPSRFRGVARNDDKRISQNDRRPEREACMSCRS